MIGLVQINTILMLALEEAKDSLVNGIVQRDHPAITCSMPNNVHDKVVSVTFSKIRYFNHKSYHHFCRYPNISVVFGGVLTGSECVPKMLEGNKRCNCRATGNRLM